MPLAIDGFPLEEWTLPGFGFGPFVVDEWTTSFKSKQKAYRVYSEKTGFQVHARKYGATIQFDGEYAQAICDAANRGELKVDSFPS